MVQSIFRTIFRRIVFDYYDVPSEKDLWNLIQTIGLNKIRKKVEFHSAAKRDYRRECSINDSIACEGIDEDQLESLAQEILSDLPAECRHVAELRLMGYKIGEVSKIIHRSKRTTERLLQQCRTILDNKIGSKSR